MGYFQYTQTRNARESLDGWLRGCEKIEQCRESLSNPLQKGVPCEKRESL
ncbi:hypothetical protein [Azotobacter armeniacus]